MRWGRWAFPRSSICARRCIRPFSSSSSSPSSSVTASSPSISPSVQFFSGIQPTGVLHLGNYVGAVQPWLRIQQEIERVKGNKLMIAIVDLHALTVPQPPSALSDGSLSLACFLIACGLKPQSTSLFLQSHVPQHSELTWLLSCLTPQAWLNHMTQYKEKARGTTTTASLGLYCYPLLMAADILLYKTTTVPVGLDQAQHLELTRSIAQRFNSTFTPQPSCSLFPLPLTLTSSTPRLMSLRDPTKKMSKSDPVSAGRIDFTDSDDAIAHKLRKAVTDSDPSVRDLLGPKGEGREGMRNLVRLLCECSGRTEEDVVMDPRYEAGGKRQLKEDAAAAAIGVIAPVRRTWERLRKDEGWVRDVLRDGAREARQKAEQTMAEVKQVMGLVGRL